MAGKRPKKNQGVLGMFLLLLVAGVAYYLALAANTLHRLYKWAQRTMWHRQHAAPPHPLKKT